MAIGSYESHHQGIRRACVRNGTHELEERANEGVSDVCLLPGKFLQP